MGYVGAVVGVRPCTKGERRVRKSFQGQYQGPCGPEFMSYPQENCGGRWCVTSKAHERGPHDCRGRCWQEYANTPFLYTPFSY